MLAVHRLRRFLALPPADQGLLIRAFISLGVVDIALRLAGFQWVMRRARSVSQSSSPHVDAQALSRARRYAHWLSCASRNHIVRARCLHRSLVLHRWLRQENLPSILRIGVRKEGDDLKAHAWVELAGQPVNDPPSAVAPFTLLANPHRAASWVR